MKTASKWKFADEWLVPVVTDLPSVGAKVVESLRAAKSPFLSDALLHDKLATAAVLAEAVKAKFGFDAETPDPQKIDGMAKTLLNEKLSRRYGVVALRLREDEIEVATANPLDLEVLSDLQAVTGRAVRPIFAPHADILNCLEQLFGSDAQVFDLLAKMGVEEEVAVIGEAAAAQAEEEIRAPVIRLVNSIIVDAMRRKASDIHIEHAQTESVVRYRIDGALETTMHLPREIGSGPIVARIKIMSNLDVANHMRPQDGRAKLQVGAIELGLRVSILPTAFGEKVVIRILDKRAAQVPLAQLGLAPDVAKNLERLAAMPQGIILVTGPTGSGKTTTLYSILNLSKSDSTNIVTIEDPIEYRLEGINQVQIDEKQGLNFAGVLRSVLRQDPDVIMVGEIRDRETAEIALQAAMTGHLVFSTLHTNDTISTISRLVDMGVERFKLAPSLLAITAQRLVRRLCGACRVALPSEQIPTPIANAMREQGLEPKIWSAAGCHACQGKGYAGRASLVEMLTLDNPLRDVINSGARESEIRAAALRGGNLRTMTYDTLIQIQAGGTDLSEALGYLNLTPETTSPPRPVAVNAALAADVPAAVARPPRDDSKVRVLVADDDQIMRLLAHKALEANGYEAIDAVDGAHALEMIDKTTPDLVLLDLHMPRLDGFAVIKSLRENVSPRHSALPIIMLTTETDAASQELALSLGADDYVIKPVKAGVLAARVAAALRRAGKKPATEKSHESSQP